MTLEQLVTAGVALYGLRWQRAIAKPLGVSEGMVRHWIEGRNKMPAELGAELIELLVAKETECKAARRALRRRS